ncbi:MAG: hypothetical protein AAGA80_19715 [Cyanobacteria bacterium P01_F01_bin.143]
MDFGRLGSWGVGELRSFGKKFPLHIYGMIYGVFAFIIVLFLDSLITSGSIKIEGLGLSNIWWKAILIGISTKGFMKIKLWTANIGSSSFPIGIDSIVQLFEPWLLETIKLSHFNEVRSFLQDTINRHSNLSIDDIKNKMERNIPSTLKDKDKKVFKLDLIEAQEPIDAMELYLGTFGRESLERVFP